MSLIQFVKTYIGGYSGLKSGAPLWINHLSAERVGYTIVPTAGTKVLESYINGKSRRAFPFAFQSMEITADQASRIESIGFYETFADWLESQTESGNLPTLGEGKTPELIEATGWAYLMQEGQSDTGVYQVQCRLVYEQD